MFLKLKRKIVQSCKTITYNKFNNNNNSWNKKKRIINNHLIQINNNFK